MELLSHHLPDLLLTYSAIGCQGAVFHSHFIGRETETGRCLSYTPASGKGETRIHSAPGSARSRAARSAPIKTSLGRAF